MVFNVHFIQLHNWLTAIWICTAMYTARCTPFAWLAFVWFLCEKEHQKAGSVSPLPLVGDIGTPKLCLRLHVCSKPYQSFGEETIICRKTRWQEKIRNKQRKNSIKCLFFQEKYYICNRYNDKITTDVWTHLQHTSSFSFITFTLAMKWSGSLCMYVKTKWNKQETNEYNEIPLQYEVGIFF